MTSEINSHFLSIEINHGQNKALVKVRTHGTMDSYLTAKVKKVFEEQYTQGKLVQELDFTQPESKLVSKSRPISKSSPSSATDLDVKVIRGATHKVLPMRRRTFQESFRKLYDRGPKNVPIVQFIWKLVVYPLAIFYRALYPTVRDLSGLRKQATPNDGDALLTALK